MWGKEDTADTSDIADNIHCVCKLVCFEHLLSHNRDNVEEPKFYLEGFWNKYSYYLQFWGLGLFFFSSLNNILDIDHVFHHKDAALIPLVCLTKVHT